MQNDMKLPVVSIVGRPNVGKSSLFNRLLGTRHAVIEENEGTTRDRIEKTLEIRKRKIKLVDTGGFMLDKRDGMAQLIKKQIEKGIEASDILLFVCDGEKGLLPLDLELSGNLRKSGKRIILIVNKIDRDKKNEGLIDFYEAGLGEPLGISCLHNRGIRKVLDELITLLPEQSQVDIEKHHPIRIAIAGRPNVGKSSFLNKVLDEERAIVHETPGTTRDSIDTYFTEGGVFFLLVDTAGIRHKRKVKNPVDVYSIMRAKDSIDRSDIVLLLLDGEEGVTSDDAKLFDYITWRGKGTIIVVNKWDLVKEIEMARYEKAILQKMPQARHFPIAFISAKTGRNVLATFNMVKAVKTNADLFINSKDLRRFLKDIDPERVRVSRKHHRPKFFYMIQMKTSPKTFAIFVNDPERIQGSHTSYIENRLRERFPLRGLPVGFVYRQLSKRRSS